MKKRFLLINMVLISFILIIACSSLFTLQVLNNKIRYNKEIVSDLNQLSSQVKIELREIKFNVSQLFHKKKQSDVEFLKKQVDKKLKVIHQKVSQMNQKKFERLLKEEVTQKENHNKTKKISIENLLKKIDSKLEETNSVYNNVLSLIKNQRKNLRDLPEEKNKLSKLYRQYIHLRDIDHKGFYNLTRGITTILHTQSARDINFSGKSKFESGFEKLYKLASTEKEKTELKKLKNQFESTYSLLRNQISTRSDTSHFDSKIKETTNLIITLNQSAHKIYEDSLNDLITLSRTIEIIIFILSIVSIATGLILGLFLTKKPISQINSLIKTAKNISAGDYSEPIIIESSDEFGELSKALKQMKEDLESRESNDKEFIDQVSSLISCSIQGDLSKKLSIEEVNAHYELSQMLNEFIAIIANIIANFASIQDSLSHGDLTKQMGSNYKGKFGEIAGNTNKMSEKLSKTISSIILSANTVRQGIEELSQGTQDLSHRTEEQSHSIGLTASSLKSVSQSAQDNALQANNANQFTQEMKETALAGGKTIHDVADAVSAINDSSMKINAIINVIDDIAFQTNILALNAAVEAARAGEEGRGFSVVANEVRSLAGRSASAAKEIKDLIKESVEKVKVGNELVQTSQKMIKEIVNQVSKVSEMIDKISSSSDSQSIEINEINQAIMKIDNINQKNTALVEEATAAGSSIEEQSKQMIKLLKYFKLDS